MASKARIEITAEDRGATAKVHSLRGAFEQLKTGAKDSILTGVGLGAGMTAANLAADAIKKTVAYLGDAIAAAREETASVAQMTASLAANSAAFDGNTKAIEETIKQRMSLAFADDEQRQSLAQLTAITKDHNKALDLQRTAMDLARLRNIDLGAASDLLGKVYGGNLGILSRYGIVLEKGTTATEALAAIQKMAAGQAQAFADSEQGAADSASLAFGELAEDVGSLLLPAFTEIAKFARDVVVPALRFLVEWIGILLRPIGLFFDIVRGFFELVGGVIANFAMDFGEQGDKIHGLAERLGTDFDDIKDRVKQRMAETGESFDDAVSGIRIAAAEELGAAAQSWDTAMLQMVERTRAGGQEIADAAETMAEAPLASFRERMGAYRSTAYQSMVEYAKGLLDAQNEPRVALDAMHQIAAEELTATEEMARLKGALASEQLAAGLMSNLPATRAAAQAARQAIVNRLETLGADAWDWGYNISGEMAAGMKVGKGVVVDAASQLASSVRRVIAINSEPEAPDSPLRGVTKWGGNLVHTIASGIRADLDEARRAAGALGGALVPGLSPAALAGASGAGTWDSMVPAVPAGGPLVIQLQLDGRTVAEVVDRHLYYLASSGPSILPRGS